MEFTSRNLNAKKLVQTIDWNGVLTLADVSINFILLSDTIGSIMDDIAPRQTVRISGKQRFAEPWMTTALEQSAHKKHRLYRKMLQKNSSEKDRLNYRSYRNTYNRLKRHSQESYYQKKTTDFKNNMKELWKVINKVISKKGRSGSIIPYITVDGIKITDPDGIANNFREFYSSLGSNLAKKIPGGHSSIKDYLRKIPRNVNSMMLTPTTQQEVISIIGQLPLKSSSGHDGMSNVLLKSLKDSLIYPLTLIFNQLLHMGEFPKRMKLAKVIPLYKNKAMDHLVNYLPISLLMTMSKVLEKLVYKRVSSFIDRHEILYMSQYGF